ncbi:MAG: ABC transporter permease, partial [Bacteroidota bacterium]
MNKAILFKNYLKLGFRNIKRNMVSSMINIFGLSIAISFAITIYIFADMQLNMDKFHQNGQQTYLLSSYLSMEGDDNLWCGSPLLLGPQIKADNPAIEAFTRYEYRTASVKRGVNVFEETITFVDEDFMDIFSFAISKGNRDALKSRNQIMISDEMATKYFEYNEPIGQELSFKFTNGKIQRFTVGAVMEKQPYNSSLTGQIYIPFDNFESIYLEEKYNWSHRADATFVQLKAGKNLSDISGSFSKYIDLQLGSNADWKMEKINPIGLYDMSTESHKMLSSVSLGGHPAGRLALSIMALLLLGMACFNFMNISVASSTKRLKEIALRKVMGGIKKQIIQQFLVENILQCFFALAIGAVLAYFLMIPAFDHMIPQMDLKFRSYEPESLVIFLLSLLLVIGIISGSYPAFYISRFEAIAIFKGNQKFGSGNFFSRAMLGVQFFLATLTIVGCFSLTDQSIHLAEKDWGYNPKGIFSFYVYSQEQLDMLEKEIISLPELKHYTTATNLIGRGIPLKSIEYENKKISARVFGSSENFVETMQLRLLKGRSLTDQTSDQQSSVVVNETFLEQMEWQDDPINKTFVLDSTRYKIVGVVGDFHYFSFYNSIQPVIITGLKNNTPKYISMSCDKDKIYQLERKTREIWAGIAPNDPFDVVFQEDTFNDFYSENRTNIILTIMVSTIAIILACLGLYGLLSFNIQKKLREFSIRKVLGADPKSIAKIAGKQYTWVLMIAFLLGAPLGYWGMSQLIGAVFPDPKGVSVIPLIVAVSVITITLIATVTGQVLKAINVNPANILRSE